MANSHGIPGVASQGEEHLVLAARGGKGLGKSAWLCLSLQEKLLGCVCPSGAGLSVPPGAGCRVLVVATAWHCWSNEPEHPCDPALPKLPAAPAVGLGGAHWGSPEGKILLKRWKSHPHIEKVKSHLQEGFCQQRECAWNFGRALNFTPG